MRKLNGPRISGCWVWATWRFLTRGGYLVIRKSRWGPWPHFMWSRKLKIFWGYSPINAEAGLIRLWPLKLKLAPPFFRGKVKRDR